MGIVSAKGRATGVGDGSYEDFLQTDAPINRGNSGGALVDIEGRLVGINAQILSPSGGNIGLGFAIPVSMVRAVSDQLIRGGVVHRGKLGVTAQFITPDLASSLGLGDTRGALVSSVESGSPAATAGLRAGDVIVAVDGHGVADANALRNMIAAVRPGSTTSLSVLRDGKRRDLTAQLTEREAQASEADQPGPADAHGNSGLGMRVRPVTPELAREIGAPAGTHGLLVTAVAADSPAAAADIRAGDIILSVDSHEVSAASELRDLLAPTSASKPALLLVNRQGATLFVALPRHDR
jgi:S1-C subfamily serine protease